MKSKVWVFNASRKFFVGDATKVGSKIISLEDILEGGTFVGLEFLDGLFKIFAGLVPLVDACQ